MLRQKSRAHAHASLPDSLDNLLGANLSFISTRNAVRLVRRSCNNVASSRRNLPCSRDVHPGNQCRRVCAGLPLLGEYNFILWQLDPFFRQRRPGMAYLAVEPVPQGLPAGDFVRLCISAAVGAYLIGAGQPAAAYSGQCLAGTERQRPVLHGGLTPGRLKRRHRS